MGTDYLSIRITEDQAAKIAQDLYGVQGEISSLPGWVDFNFRIKSDSGTFLLKVSRLDTDVKYIEFQQSLLGHMASCCIGVESPTIIPNLQGNQLSEIADDAGHTRMVRLLSWIEGRLWSGVHPISNHLLFSLGAQAGNLAKALQDFDHPMAYRKFEWDIAQARWTYDYLHLFTGEQRSIVAYFQDQYKLFQDQYQQLRKGVIHNDVNDNNVIVTHDLIEPQVKAIVDFGDVIHTQIINDLATAIAYAVMGKSDLLSAALPIVEGYHQHYPLEETELGFLYNLVGMRLVISVTKSAMNKQAEPDNEYLLISEKPAWEVLNLWKNVKEEHALYSFRNACKFTPHPKEEEFKKWVKNNGVKLSALFQNTMKEQVHPLDLSVSSPWVGHQSEWDDQDHFQYKLIRLQTLEPDKIIAGGYLEPRAVYTSPAYEKRGDNGIESRTIHLGIDLWEPAGTPVYALFDSTIVTAVNDAGVKEYGGLVILKHRSDQFDFFTLHGHLSLESLENIKVGQLLKPGERIGYIGNYLENGNWVPHLHFQIMLSTLGYVNDFPGVAYPNELEVWRSICPDPNLLFNIPGLELQPVSGKGETLAYRKKHLGKSLILSYQEPLKIVRGSGAYLMDDLGRKYLDTVNNVAHVGHEHPDVVRAGQQQMSVLNTNTRYLHDKINEFAESLLSTFPEELSVVHFVNSGSEANELALRMVRACTGERDMIAVEVGYHGNTSGCVDVSSYKFDGKSGTGAPEHTHIVPLPDSYRGIYQGEMTGARYAGHIREQINHIQSLGRNLAGFICESIISCGGQIELPEGYLPLAYEAVRNAGGICIADEVQVGCGRVGSEFWGFQLHHVTPDIVTIGKPIGNGHPLAAVVCTRQVADAFANGMEYFNTFGGNPVSCAIGREVLSVIEKEGLQEHALKVGVYLKTELKKMQNECSVIGDIRGQGLFLGIELADHSRMPLTEKAAYMANRMKDLGVLMSTDGKDDNVLKIKPPLVFSMTNADELLSALRTVFQEDFMRQ